MFNDHIVLVFKLYQTISLQGAWMPSMPGTEERGQSSPSTETTGKPTAIETLTQTASDKS